MVRTICYIQHFYPKYTEEEILGLTQSKIGTLIEMGGAINNPSVLDKYKPLKFNSEFELEHYIIDKFKFI